MRDPNDAPATKNDVSAAVRPLAREIVKLNLRIDRLEISVNEKIESMGPRIISTVDAFMAQVGKVDRAQIIADWRLTEIEKRLSAVEARPS